MDSPEFTGRASFPAPKAPDKMIDILIANGLGDFVDSQLGPFHQQGSGPVETTAESNG